MIVYTIGIDDESNTEEDESIRRRSTKLKPSPGLEDVAIHHEPELKSGFLALSKKGTIRIRTTRRVRHNMNTMVKGYRVRSAFRHIIEESESDLNNRKYAASTAPAPAPRHINICTCSYCTAKRMQCSTSRRMKDQLDNFYSEMKRNTQRTT